MAEEPRTLRITLMDRIAELEAESVAHVARVEGLETVIDAILPLYHAANCLVGQADPDSTVATVLTPALVAYEQAVTKGQQHGK